MIGTYHRFTCSEGFSQVEGYQAAINDKENMWHCHHRLESHYYNNETGKWTLRDIFLTENDLRCLGKYDSVPAYELIFMPVKEHLLLHKSGKHNGFYGKKVLKEHSEKISNSLKETYSKMTKEEKSEKYGSFKGKHHKEETKNKVSNHHKVVREAYLDNNMGLSWNQFQKYYKEKNRG